MELYLQSLPPINNLEQFKPNIVTKIYSGDGEIIKTFTAYTYEKIDLKDIPDNLKKALIATEDKNFYRHHGYDLTGLARSTVQNVLAGHVVQGASTITQQLARVLFLNNERTFDRKLKELFIAARIEKTISKDQILEMYMNNVYLGAGAYGVEGAAQIYFDKHLKDCDLAELALIAGLPQAPSVYNPFNNMDLAVQRRNQVLTRMYKMRYITTEEYEKAKEEKVHLAKVPQFYTTNKAPYFCDYVMKELEKLGFDETEISQGGYKVVDEGVAAVNRNTNARVAEGMATTIAVGEAIVENDDENAAEINTKIGQEGAATRATVQKEGQKTRGAVHAEGRKTRAAVHAEGAATRAAVHSEGDETRRAVRSEGLRTRRVVRGEAGRIRRENRAENDETRQTVKNEGQKTRAKVQAEADRVIDTLDPVGIKRAVKGVRDMAARAGKSVGEFISQNPNVLVPGLGIPLWSARKLISQM